MLNNLSRDIIIECKPVGNSVRVTAVDATTGTEAVFQAPIHASSADIRRMAVSKLSYVMNKAQRK